MNRFKVYPQHFTSQNNPCGLATAAGSLQVLSSTNRAPIKEVLAKLIYGSFVTMKRMKSMKGREVWSYQGRVSSRFAWLIRPSRYSNDVSPEMVVASELAR